MRQLIIARKDLNMSPGKLAAQVSHASMAFISTMLKAAAKPVWKYKTLPAVIVSEANGDRLPRMYTRYDLSLFAMQAYKEGKDSFAFRPVNADDPEGDIEVCENEIEAYSCDVTIQKDIYEEWFCGIFTKTICEAKNRNHLLKAVTMAEELGLKEGIDFFLIKDNCLTELEPEEIGEDGIGRTLTAIGFRPLTDEIAHAISRKFQLYK